VQPAGGRRIGRQGCRAAAAEAADENGGGVRMRADLLAGCCGTAWNPKDPVALVTDYRCCSEGMWRDRVELGGRPVSLLITQRSRVQIPPPPPLATRAFATSGGRPSGSLGTGCSRPGRRLGVLGWAGPGQIDLVLDEDEAGDDRGADRRVDLLQLGDEGAAAPTAG
jgi:hypothetical protein